jgi:hypothetical protein
MTMNPIIKGQANYYRSGASKKAFQKLDDHLRRCIYKWARRRHPRKPWKWISTRYFGAFNPSRRNRWVFGDRDSGAYLHQYAWTKIVRHAPVPGRYSPDDPALAHYWTDRRRKRKPPQLAESWERHLRTQQGLCPLCRELLLYARPPTRNTKTMGKLVSRNTQSDSPPSHHRARQQPDDLPPCSRPLRQTPTKRTSARPQPVKRTMPARPRRLLEPCAVTNGTHGSEGGPPQQCGGPTRQQKPLSAGCGLA